MGEQRPEGKTPLAIEVHELSRRFGSRTAIDRLSLGIPARASFGLLGANGAGKTTFIRMLAGYLLPSAGSVRVDGMSPVRRPSEVQARMGFVMETSRLYPELRVRSFLRFMGGARGLRGAALERAVEAALERLALQSVAGRPIGNLSKGFQQRISLAQAFVHDPSIVVVDEPTSGLDPVQREEVQGLLEALEGERTVLVCTHDLNEARRLTSRVGVLNAGRLVAEGPTPELLGDSDALELFRPQDAGEPA